MMSSQDRSTQYTNFSPHQLFEFQDQQPRTSNKQIPKPNKCNNQLFELQLSTTQARRQKKLQRVKDERPKEKKTTTIEWDDGRKIGIKNKLYSN